MGADPLTERTLKAALESQIASCRDNAKKLARHPGQELEARARELACAYLEEVSVLWNLSDSCPSCSRKDAALREIAVGRTAEDLGCGVAVDTMTAARLCQIARAALAEAAPAAGEHKHRWTDGCVECGAPRFWVAPPAAPEPETIDLMQALKDRLAKLASERVELTPLQRECMQQAIDEAGDPAPEPQREEE